MLGALREDALTTTADGFALRLSLPWIRSLPLASLGDIEVSLDGSTVPGLTVAVGERLIAVSALAFERGWWFVQDRVVLHGRVPVEGVHDVTVDFRLLVPYLQAGPDGPLRLPFRFERTLRADTAPLLSSIARDVS